MCPDGTDRGPVSITIVCRTDFVAGCFGGMWLADRLGDRAFRVLGVAAGVLVALVLTLVGAMYLR